MPAYNISDTMLRLLGVLASVLFTDLSVNCSSFHDLGKSPKLTELDFLTCMAWITKVLHRANSRLLLGNVCGHNL